jgi:pimeloyl-ACP methyl ester carboxylesterase
MAVVLLHGAGLTGGCWDLVRALVPGATAPSLPGRPDGPPAPTVAAMARALLPALPSGPLTLVGHSMGGAVAMELALGGLVQIERLVLISTGARLRVNPAILTVVDAMAPLDVVALSGSANAVDGAHALIRQDAARVPAATAAADWHACDAFDVRERFPSLAMPVDVWVGEDDAVTPVKYAQWMASTAPTGRLVVVPGAGHLMPLERPEVVVRALREAAGSG